jgi:hypothetical protein
MQKKFFITIKKVTITQLSIIQYFENKIIKHFKYNVFPSANIQNKIFLRYWTIKERPKGVKTDNVIYQRLIAPPKPVYCRDQEKHRQDGVP